MNAEALRVRATEIIVERRHRRSARILAAACAAAGPTVSRKPKAAPAPADVVDATPAAPSASVSAEEKAAAGGAQPPAATSAPAPAPAADGKMAGAGEIAYLTKKAEGLGTTPAALAADLGMAGLVIEAGKLAKTDFDTLRAELMKRGA